MLGSPTNILHLIIMSTILLRRWIHHNSKPMLTTTSSAHTAWWSLSSCALTCTGTCSYMYLNTYAAAIRVKLTWSNANYNIVWHLQMTSSDNAKRCPYKSIFYSASKLCDAVSTCSSYSHPLELLKARPINQAFVCHSLISNKLLKQTPSGCSTRDVREIQEVTITFSQAPCKMYTFDIHSSIM